MKYILILFGCLMFSVGAFADTPAQQLDVLLKNMHSLHANFSETVVNGKNKKLLSASGKLDLQRPGKFRWEITTGTPQLIVANGQKIWIYDPDLEQVSVRHLQNVSGDIPALLLSRNDVASEKNFSVSQDARNSQSYILKPRDKSSLFAEIRMIFSDGVIRHMQFRDHLGQVTDIRFDHVIMNPALSQKLFHFTPPPHTDIINEF